jgi:hypothetical protein
MGLAKNALQGSAIGAGFIEKIGGSAGMALDAWASFANVSWRDIDTKKSDAGACLAVLGAVAACFGVRMRAWVAVFWRF